MFLDTRFDVGSFFRVDAPERPASKAEARFQVAVAANEDEIAPKDDQITKKTGGAKLHAEIGVYEKSAHDWCPPDSRVYNEPLAEKAWARLLALYQKALA
jgi:carboxymethylenebutenolidase